MAELGAEEVDLVRVYRTFNAASEPFPRGRAHRREDRERRSRTAVAPMSAAGGSRATGAAARA